MPRHTKLTPAIQKRLVDAINVGATHRIACDYAGIAQSTLYVWFEKAQAGRAPYVEFVEQLKLSEGSAAVGWLAKIEKAANEGNWQAAAWKLERRYPSEYGRTVLEHAGEVQHNIVRLPVKAQTEDEWMAANQDTIREDDDAHSA